MIQLKFEYRSSGLVVSSINLQSDGCRVLEFIPEDSAENTVTESCDLLIEKSSAADLQSKIRSIEAMIKFAKTHKTGPEGIWVLYSPDTSTPWQSRVIDGEIILDKKTDFLWEKYKKVLQIVFERGNYWETEDPVTLELSNSSVTDQTAAPIANCQDASHDLYVEIAADQVEGVLPTPAILEFLNTQNDTTEVDELLVGILHGNGLTTPPSPGTLVIEGIGVVDAACSGGFYDEMTWPDAAENLLESWYINSGDFIQKKYRCVARLRDAVAYEDLWLKVKLLDGSVAIAETRWMLVEAGQELVVIGSLTIPPYLLGEAVDIGTLTLGLYEKRASGSGTLNMDYMLLMPQDAWRRYGAISGLDYNEKLIDDPVRGVLITQFGANYLVTHKVDEGEPLMLRPGVKNYLYFLQMDDAGEAPIARTASVTVKCHPRRLTV